MDVSSGSKWAVSPIGKSALLDVSEQMHGATCQTVDVLQCSTSMGWSAGGGRATHSTTSLIKLIHFTFILMHAPVLFRTRSSPIRILQPVQTCLAEFAL